MKVNLGGGVSVDVTMSTVETRDIRDPDVRDAIGEEDALEARRARHSRSMVEVLMGKGHDHNPARVARAQRRFVEWWDDLAYDPRNRPQAELDAERAQFGDLALDEEP